MGRRRAASWARTVVLALVSGAATGCPQEGLLLEGQSGRAIPLATGDGLPLPRLMSSPGCDGAPGGCDALGGGGECRPILLDTLAPLTSLSTRDGTVSFTADACLELRASRGLVAAAPTAPDLAQSVTRMRLRGAAAALIPEDEPWAVGDERAQQTVAGALGGSLLRQFALRLRDLGGDLPTATFYETFPGTESEHAAQGRAFLPVTFPGRLLGRDADDRCRVGDADCGLPGVDLDPDRQHIALEPHRMVMDTCFAPPPCALAYAPVVEATESDPGSRGDCALTPDGDIASRCRPDRDATCCEQRAGSGQGASLLLATSVEGLVIFDDSAPRLLGAQPSELPLCADVVATDRACRIDARGTLAVPGWPDASNLPKVRVRAVAVVPGSPSSTGDGACRRWSDRLRGLRLQCDLHRSQRTGDPARYNPPYAAFRESADDQEDEPSNSSVAIFGETKWRPLDDDAPGPDPSVWIDTRILPADHPLALSLRQDVAPDATLDGLLGTVFAERAIAVLDYTDPNPALRVRCLDDDPGGCVSLPNCATEGDPSCCYGMPLSLLAEWISDDGIETCCRALSAAVLAEFQDGVDRCLDQNPP